MPTEKPTYKELNGTTRIGDFLRKLGKSDFLSSVFKTAENLGVPFIDIIGDILLANKEISEADKLKAIELIKFDIEEAKEVSKRWSNDMLSDSFLSKNIRPMVLIYSWILITLMIFFKNEINEAYITLIQGLAISVNVAYFGGREISKITKIKRF